MANNLFQKRLKNTISRSDLHRQKREFKMTKKLLLMLFVVFFISSVLGSCEEGQVDINTASVEDLDKIIWVGSTTAENIINSRPFESLDDLTKVSGIGEIKLQDIKEQGLACVDDAEEFDEQDTKDTDNSQDTDTTDYTEEADEFDDEDNKESDENQESKESDNKESSSQTLSRTLKSENQDSSDNKESKIKTKELEIIKLNTNSQTKKTLDEKEKQQDNYARYSFIVFCILLAILLTLNRKKYKNEFNLARIMIDIIQDHTGLEFPANEVNMIAALLRATYIRLRPYHFKKVLVICPSGIVTAQLLTARLTTRFPRLGKLTVISYRELDPDMVAQADLIITLMPLSEDLVKDKPVINVSAQLLPEDVEAITNFLT